MDLYKLCMLDKILEYFQAGLSYMGSNKYSGGYGPKGMYVNRNRGLSLDRLQGNGYSNGNSLQTSPTRRPSYGLTRTRSQAHLLAHSVASPSQSTLGLQTALNRLGARAMQRTKACLMAAFRNIDDTT